MLTTENRAGEVRILERERGGCEVKVRCVAGFGKGKRSLEMARVMVLRPLGINVAAARPAPGRDSSCVSLAI